MLFPRWGVQTLNGRAQFLKLLHHHPSTLDHGRPFLDFALEEVGEIPWRASLIRNDLCAKPLKALAHLWCLHGLHSGLVQSANDRFWRVLGQKDRIPD